VKIHCVQVDSNLGESPSSRLSRVLNLINSVELDTDLLILPEHWICGAFNDYSEVDLPLRLYEDFIFQATEIAKHKNFHILSGSGLVFDLQRNIRNATFLISPLGVPPLSYYKIHPFSQELGDISGGKEILSFRIAETQVSAVICYDLRFPEIFRQPVNFGSELFIVIAAWPQPRIETWKHLLRARAIENQAYVVGVNGTGVQDTEVLGGNSMVIGPSGEILASLENSESDIKFELNLELVYSHRMNFPYLEDVKLLQGFSSKPDGNKS